MARIMTNALRHKSRPRPICKQCKRFVRSASSTSSVNASSLTQSRSLSVINAASAPSDNVLQQLKPAYVTLASALLSFFH